jgi:hypothetical protein
MTFLHICNTFFERELESTQKIDRACKAALHLKRWLSAHPATERLQYLPLLYAGPNDRVLVSRLPDHPDPRLVTFDQEIPSLPIKSWGASSSIEFFAKETGLVFESPSFDLVREIQSKEFTYHARPHLPGSALLGNAKDVIDWIATTQGRKVLKKVLGFAGQGHFFVDKDANLIKFLNKEFSQGRPIIGEPWLDRIFDFSSQWEIGEEIILQGFTVFETSENGAYSATLAGPLDQLFVNYRWAVDEHLKVAMPILEKILAMGFYGSLGIDAFIYGNNLLNPVVEINARKTMSHVALLIQKQRSPQKILRMSFESKAGGLLPGSFSRNIFLSDLLPNL